MHPGFVKFCLTVGFASQWQENADGLRDQGSAILAALQKANTSEAVASELPGTDSVQLCVEQLTKSYEPKMGGFGKAPKFPQPGISICSLQCVHIFNL